MRFSCEQLQRNLLKKRMQFQFVLLIILSTIWLEIYQVFVFVYWIKVPSSWIFCFNAASWLIEAVFMNHQLFVLHLHAFGFLLFSRFSLGTAHVFFFFFFFFFFLMTPKWEAVWAPLHTTHPSHNPQALTSKPPLYTSHNPCIHLPC